MESGADHGLHLFFSESLKALIAGLAAASAETGECYWLSTALKD